MEEHRPTGWSEDRFQGRTVKGIEMVVVSSRNKMRIIIQHTQKNLSNCDFVKVWEHVKELWISIVDLI